MNNIENPIMNNIENPQNFVNRIDMIIEKPHPVFILIFCYDCIESNLDIRELLKSIRILKYHHKNNRIGKVMYLIEDTLLHLLEEDRIYF